MKTKTCAVLPALVCGAILAFLPTIRAQDPTPAATATPAATVTPAATATPDAKPKTPLIDKLTTDLNLTPDQQAKIKPILMDRHTKVKAIRDDASLSKQQKKEQLKEIGQTTDGQIKAILTPDQQTKFDMIKGEMKANHGKHGQ